MTFQEQVDDMFFNRGRRKFRIASPDQLERMLESRFGRVTKTNGHNGMEFIIACPVCGRRKLSVNSVTGVYKCWRGCCSGVVSKLLDSKVPMTAAPAQEVKKAKEFVDPGELKPLNLLGEDNPAIVYLRSRKFDTGELSSVFGLKYCSSGRRIGPFNTTNTVMIPVVMDGKTVGWQSRLLYDPDKLTLKMCEAMGFQWKDGKYVKPPKYLTMPGMDKGRILWNYDNARKSDVVVVTEGVFDAARVGKCGVATFGKSVSDFQVDLLQQYWKLIVLLLDPDAEKDAEKLERKFSCGNVLRVTLQGVKDAGESTRTDIWSQVFDAAAARGIDLGSYHVDI